MNKIIDKNILEYRKTAKKLWEKNKDKRQKRKEKAFILTELAAQILKEKFSVEKVALFGSLIREDCFNLWSDIDLAVWGLQPNQIFKAMETVKNLDDEIEINLVAVETLNSNLLISIQKEGRLL